MSNNPQQTRDESTVRLLGHLFHTKFKESDPQITDATAGQVLPVYFLGWLDANMILLDPAIECEAAGVPYEIWEFTKEIVSNPAGVERITPLWPYITIGNRSAPEHKLKSLTWNMLLEWEDGVMLPIQLHVNQVMVDEKIFDDATVASILTSRAQIFSNAVIEQGLDGLHAQGQSYGGEQPFNVLMGMMLQMLNGNFYRKETGSEEPVKIKEELIPYIRDYMRLCQAMIQPPIPIEVRQALAARQQASGKAATGGWDA